MKAQLSKCTFTGVDESTNLTQLAILSVIGNSLFEFGFLYSEERQGSPTDLRYPSASFIDQALKTLDKDIPVALHVCGQAVFALSHGDPDSEVYKLVYAITQRNGRVQLNLNARKTPDSDLERLVGFIRMCAMTVFIVQYNENNLKLFDLLQMYKQRQMGCLNVSWLVDASGGRGVLPEAGIWQPPVGDVRFGYAGGLGSDNLASQLPLIKAVVPDGQTFWVDMEQKLRNDQDLFDLDKVAACAKIVLDFKKNCPV